MLNAKLTRPMAMYGLFVSARASGTYLCRWPSNGSSAAVTTNNSHLAYNTLQGMMLSYNRNFICSLIRSDVLSANSSDCSVLGNNGFVPRTWHRAGCTLLYNIPRDLLP
jgi:hypothetical protein